MSTESQFITDDQREQFVRDGFVRVAGLIPTATVESTREAIADALELDESDPRSWEGKPSTLGDLWQPTVACKTEEIYQAAGELVGPNYSTDPRGYSPYREARGMDPWGEGFIPVLRYPESGPVAETGPQLTGWHIDGMHLTSFWPLQRYLVLFIYLSDVSERGGATVVRPGSHRQVFERGYRRYHAAPEAVVSYTEMSDLHYQDPIAVEGHAGDVLFMHYLMVHSGSLNYDHHIRYGLNSSIRVDSARPYRHRDGAPEADWTPLDYTMRIDNLPEPAALAPAG